ncbi:MAG: DNA topoisomerase 3 [Silvanigrellales bacterium]|nr:DNA topoisomerase 3 [Silvanigrellales bacterium]
MKLIIAEKPSVGIEIARAVGALARKSGYFEGGGYVVSWAAGHLVELQEPDLYKPEWAWKRDFSRAQLPMIPNKFELRVSKRGTAQFSVLKNLMHRTDVASLVNACDAGREGELIFDYIYRAAKCEKPFERLWTSAALTQEAIKREMQSLRPGELFAGLRMAARARAAADWLVGMNGTRAVTMSQRGALYTVGRVQTPVLAFIVEREKEIRAFIPETFTSLHALFLTPRNEEFAARYEFARGPEETRNGGASARTHQIRDSTQAEEVVWALKSRQFAVAELFETKKTERPPFLYDLTSLQRDANRLYSFSADKTLQLAQALYEKHKAITYPRTDSKHLPHEMRRELPAALTALGVAGLPKDFVETALSRVGEQRERIFDDAKVSDHHALIPTSRAPTGLGADEARIYRLVAMRLLAAFQDDFVVAVTDAVVAAEGTEHRFYAKGKVVLQAGWTKVIPSPDSDKDVSLPRIAKSEPLAVMKFEAKQDMTKPPKRFTEADLLSLMENAGNKLETESKAILKGRGIGTPATRASILQGLIRREYVVAHGKALAPTDLGMKLIEVVRFDALKSPELTAQWERDLASIESGTMTAAQFNRKLVEMTHALTRAL